MKYPTSCHSDHRKRMKHRFLEQGFDSFNDHEKLEFLLYYALPRQDTNPIGHALIERFGSLSGVFDASIDQLCEVKGVSEHTAILIKLMPQLMRSYLCDSKKDRKNISDEKAAAEYFCTKFLGITSEEIHAAFLDSSMNILDCTDIGYGVTANAQVNVKKLVATAIATNCANVIIAHNHPGGVAIPSGSDLNTTTSCRLALEMIGVRLVEHYVISGNSYVGIINMKTQASDADYSR